MSQLDHSRDRGDVVPVPTSLGPIELRELGEGPPVVLLHAVLTNGRIWGDLPYALARRHRVIVPDLPIGAHRLPVTDRSRLTAVGVADAVAELIEARAPGGAAVVGSDTGGGLAQLLAARRPDLVRGLVLFSCDAFEHFPPPLLRALPGTVRLLGSADLLARVFRHRWAQRRLGYGLLAKAPATPALLAAIFDPMLTDREVRADLAAFLGSVRGDELTSAVDRLRGFDRPVLVAWSTDDRVFPRRDADRLVALFPAARKEPIAGARAFAFLDQPEASARLVGRFLADLDDVVPGERP